jgi:hypothetical protein
MAKYHGRIGFGIATETKPGVWSDVMVEHSYFGDVLQNRRLLQQGENLNKNLIVGNSISVVADALAREHFFAIKYAEWAGQLWTVTNITVERPRLTLQLGEVYNGPIPTGAP